MIARDHRMANIYKATLALVLFAAGSTSALAADTAPAHGDAAAPVAAGSASQGASNSDSAVTNLTGSEATDHAAGQAEAAHPVRPAASQVTLSVDRRTHIVHAVPHTVRELLASEHVRVDAYDDVSPALDTRVGADDFIRVVHARSWIAHVRARIVSTIRNRNDSRMALGRTLTLERGRPGIRETTYRYVQSATGASTRIVLASHVIRAPHARVVVHGTAPFSSLARVAQQGFESAVHVASSALHMIATAYTASCIGCSGVTASGVRAGFGVIAVDPHVIPLGTKLFIPGYGRAVAGDTGGSITGNRIDLGMNDGQAAMQFGRRSVTVYLLR